MKKILLAASLLSLIVMMIACEGCFSNKKQNTVDALNAQVIDLKNQIDSLKSADPAVCDTLGLGLIKEKPNPNAKYKKIKPWMRSKTYTLCIEIKLKGRDKDVALVIENPGGLKRYTVLKVTAGDGYSQVVHVNMKGKFTPEMYVQFFDNAGNEENTVISDTTRSVCGPGLTVKDKVMSTSSQGSTVYVTVDER